MRHHVSDYLDHTNGLCRNRPFGTSTHRSKLGELALRKPHAAADVFLLHFSLGGCKMPMLSAKKNVVYSLMKWLIQVWWSLQKLRHCFATLIFITSSCGANLNFWRHIPKKLREYAANVKNMFFICNFLQKNFMLQTYIPLESSKQRFLKKKMCQFKWSGVKKVKYIRMLQTCLPDMYLI